MVSRGGAPTELTEGRSDDGCKRCLGRDNHQILWCGLGTLYVLFSRFYEVLESN